MWHSGAFHGGFMRHPSQMAKYPTRKFTEGDDPMKEWLKPEISESEAGMEVTSYLPAELDRA
jgi:coenzyme PQQ precursor peptide PqqA